MSASREDVDEFGDSFTEPVTAESLKALIDSLPPLPQDYEVDQSAYLDIKRRCALFQSYWGFALKEMLILTRDEKLPILYIARLYGARTTENRYMEGITHHMADMGAHCCNGVSCYPGNPITKLELLERLRPWISPQTYEAFR